MIAHISCRNLITNSKMADKIAQNKSYNTKFYRIYGIGVCITWYSPGGSTRRSQPEQNERQEILDIRQVAALNIATLWWWVACAYVVVSVWLMFVHMCVKRSCLRCMVVKVWVIRIAFCFCFSHLLSILHFAVRQLLCWPFLSINFSNVTSAGMIKCKLTHLYCKSYWCDHKFSYFITYPRTIQKKFNLENSLLT